MIGGVPRAMMSARPDRDLILGVLGVQAGFVTPAQVMSAASAGLIDRGGPTMLARLELAGALSPERRRLLEAMADEALASSDGDPDRALERLGGDEAVLSTFGDALAVDQATQLSIADAERHIPQERSGQYTRLDELGRGGQSVVRRAIDEFVGREVALKELLARPTDPLATPSSTLAIRARFLREARLTAQLDHPGIVAVHEVVTRPDGTLLCAQKLIRGETLKARMARCESLQQRLVLLEHLVDACHAVAYAHSRGVIHRDLKPSNIMVGAFAETVVVDWGLAKKRGEAEPGFGAEAGSSTEPTLTAAGLALGTPAYMSPEQARGSVDQIDERSDVFSLGVILYELITGRLPFEGANVDQVIAKVQKGRFPRVRQVCPAAPAELAAVAERALELDPQRRYAGPELLATELLAFRGGERVAAYEYRSWELVKKFVGKNRALTAVSFAALLLLIGAAVAIGSQLHQARLHLAASFLERARAADESSDWARAAGYYAASRMQNDSREGRWGYALAAQRMPHRVLARRGPDESFVDVGYLPDGRALVVGLEPPWVIGREVESGRELWRFENPGRVDTATVVDAGQIRLVAGESVRFLDGATGRLVGTFALTTLPCPTASAASRAKLRVNQTGMQDVVVDSEQGEARVLAAGIARRISATAGMCVASPDGDRVALLDAQGVVRVWDLRALAEVASRPAPDASQLFFTAHGVAVVRSRAIQVFGGDTGEFFVQIPGRGGNGLMRSGVAGGAVSPDGHLLVIPRLTSDQVDVVDLRTKSVVSSLAFAAGTPRFAVSPAGDRLLIAGLLNGSFLSAWEIRPPDKVGPIAGSSRMGFLLSDDSRRILVSHAGVPYRLEVYDPGGSLVRAFDLGAAQRANASISRDGSKVVVYADNRVSIRDVTSGATVAELDCEGCMRTDLSRDGKRLVTNNGKEIILWDVATRAPLWRDAQHVGLVADGVVCSNDGRRIAWAHQASVSVHVEDGSADRELRLDDRILEAHFNADATRIAVVSRHAIGVWAVDGLRPIFRVPNPSPVYQEIRWSADDSALINWRDSLGTVLLDSRTGEAFATIGVTRPAALGANENVALDLSYRIARGDAAWEIFPLPPPDASAPEDSLARVLKEAGMEMHGVDLVYRAPERPR